jgi:hypothetical protein
VGSLAESLNSPWWASLALSASVPALVRVQGNGSQSLSIDCVSWRLPERFVSGNMSAIITALIEEFMFGYLEALALMSLVIS